MLRLFSKNLLHKSSSNNHVYLPQIQSLVQFCTNSTNYHLPTVSYLIEKCGLSLDSAISASKKISKIKSTDKPDLVLQLFKTYGFTETQLTKVFTICPKLILADPVKNLKPKFEYFESTLGFSKPDIATIICSNNTFLPGILTNQVIPTLNFLKSLLKTNGNVLMALKRYYWGLNQNSYQIVEPNIATLRLHGVPEFNISKLFMIEPRALTHTNVRFKEIVTAIEKMGFDPGARSFVLAISVMGSMAKSLWEKKVEVYKSFGLSEKDVISAFKLLPQHMRTSEKKIRTLMDFYLNELGLQPSDVSKNPNLMLVSLKMKIIPRCSVLLFLLSNGLVKKDLNLVQTLKTEKKTFEKKYVNKYKEYPEVLKAYKGELGYPRLETLRLMNF
ncbi:Transcription termination factor like [Thalictrum thalictroides]|uniref:Transcription termination factor like n=1 Tax=Thalictrum thalictroides TaxID=46969 RepID=A0A7J6WU78_THATH|nr:Transcription termination factor like [Thalictrum thalictroides]